MIRKTAKVLPDPRRLVLFGTVLILAAAAALATQARAQSLDAAELEDLVAPIALYPDDVLGIILPASTFPLDVVRAARFLDDLEADPTLEPDPAWDDSIVALLNYPEVLRMMNEDLDWTWALGEAVLTDEGAVLAAAQNFRARALAAGNLRSDDRQIVTQSEEAIEIRPADPEVVYIPVYEPREVIVYHTRPYYLSYYPFGYPLYYYPYPAGYSFSLGFFWGVTSYFSVGWHSHHLHAYHHTNRLHPYYLNSYYLYEPYYYRRNVNITINVDNYSNVWRPSPRRGARQRTATVEGRRSTVRTQRTATVESQPGAPTRSTGPVTRSGATARTGTAATRSGSLPRTTTSEVRGGGTNSTTRRVTPDSAARTPGQTGQRGEPVIGGRVERSTGPSSRTRTVTAPQSSSGVRSGTTAPVRSGSSAPARSSAAPARSGTTTASPRASVSNQSSTRRAEAAPRVGTPRTSPQSFSRPSTTARPSTPRPSSARPSTPQPSSARPQPSGVRPQAQSATRSAGSGSVRQSTSGSAPRASGASRSGGRRQAASSSSTRRAGNGRP